MILKGLYAGTSMRWSESALFIGRRRRCGGRLDAFIGFELVPVIAGDDVPVYAVVRREGVSVHLLRLDAGRPTVCALRCKRSGSRKAVDLDDLFRNVESQEAKVL